MKYLLSVGTSTAENDNIQESLDAQPAAPVVYVVVTTKPATCSSEVAR